MKRIIILTSILLFLVTGFFLFALGRNNPPLPETVPRSQLKTRPDLILKAFMEGFPKTILRVFEDDDEWAIEMHDGVILYWAEGRFLTEDKKERWEEYRAHTLYSNSGKPRDESKYTEEEIQRIKDYTDPKIRNASVLPLDDTLLGYLYNVGDEEKTLKTIVVQNFLGFEIKINSTISTQVDLISNEILALAKTEKEIADFLKTIDEVGGYFWRLIAGTQKPSNHSYGTAIDILPVNRHKHIIFWGWERRTNEDWMLVPQEDLWAPPKAVIDIFYKHGFIWGGTWEVYDNMHFEYKPESIALAKYITEE